MKASSVVRESVRAVLHCPLLVALEIGWRWSFGVLSLLFISGIASWFLRHTPVAQQDLGTLHHFDLQLAEFAVQDILVQAGDRVLLMLVVLATGIGIFWTIAAGVGRTLTLRIAAGRSAPFLPVCMAQFLRVVVTIGCAIFFVLWMWFAARLSVPSPDAPPHWGLYFLLMVLDLIVTATLWGIGNWLFWLASITAAVHDRFAGPFPSALSSARRLSRSAAHLDLEIAFGIMRTLLFVAMFTVSLIPAGLMTSGGGILPKILFIAITLAYLGMADVLQIARVKAILNLLR